MILKTKKIYIRTGQKFIAVLHQDMAHKLDVLAGDRIKLKKESNEITAIVEVSENGFPKTAIGLYIETAKELNANIGDKIHITIADKPPSVQYIRKKLDGKRLSNAEINLIVEDIVNDDITDVEMTYFVAGSYMHGLNNRETADLTKAIARHGSQLKFGNKIVVDKHCIGGVPGNRTTMIVVPIIAANGLLMPKTSSRAITSPAGTADTMEILANVGNDAVTLKKIVRTVGGFISWGGGIDLAAADDRMIRVRYPLKLDPEGMLLASIMAKKYSVSATHVLIDIPCGEQVKVKTQKEAFHLKKRFLKIAHMLGMKAEVMISDGSQPIGNGIGPLLEALDVLKVLKRGKDAPKDLEKKGIKMAGILLELAKKAKRGTGEKIARETLESGKAWEKMQEIIEAQGKKQIPSLAPFKFDVPSLKTGIVTHIDNKHISTIARVAGAPKDLAAGLYLYKKLGDKVKKGEFIMRIYTEGPARLKYAMEACHRQSCAHRYGYEIK